MGNKFNLNEKEGEKFVYTAYPVLQSYNQLSLDVLINHIWSFYDYCMLIEAGTEWLARTPKNQYILFTANLTFQKSEKWSRRDVFHVSFLNFPTSCENAFD